MIIHSKFHDYYDTALSHGRDETLHFTRAAEESVLDHKDTFLDFLPDTLTKYGFRRDKLRCHYGYVSGPFIKQFIIGFCGKIYAGEAIANHSHYPEPMRDEFFYCGYNYDKLDASLKAAKFNCRDFDSRGTNKLDSFAKIETVDPFIGLNVPYFSVVAHRDKIILTKLPKLQNYGFQKIVDPYTAMQEISMFVGGVLPRQTKELINISDADRINQYGFNENSFRHPVKLSQLYGKNK
jgi:hypothetical protein